MKKNPHRLRYYGLVFAAWAVYILLTLAAPSAQNSQPQRFSSTAILFLRITLLAPYMLTWLVAVIGWFNFNQFAFDTQRKRAPNHAAFRLISRGLGLLIFDLIGIPMISVARSVWAENEQVAASLTIVSNYLHIVVPLIAFSFLYAGSRKLALSGRYASGLRSNMLPSLLATSLFTTLLSLAVFGNTSRQMAPEAGRFATYYVSDPLIIITIILPLAITWLLGLQAALNTERYAHSLLQPLWRRAIIHFFHGLLAIVSSSIILQAITAFGSEQLQQVNLALILAVIYLFIIIQAVGYLFIKKSAKQLSHLIKAGIPHETH